MLTKKQVRQFNKDGFLLGSRILDDRQVDTLREELERVIHDRDNPQSPQPVMIRNLANPDAPVWQIVNICEASEAFHNLVYHPTIVEEIAQLLMAREVRLWHDQIQYKPASIGGVNFWHQDSPYWEILSPKDAQVSAWVALDDVDEENGCMSMVPGSHLWGNNIEFLHGLAPTGFGSMPQKFQSKIVRVKTRPVPKGTVHYHHSLTWHGSVENLSNRPRRAIALHFMSERTTYVPIAPHPMDAFIENVKPGDKLTGTHFPLVWQDSKVVQDPATV